MIRFLFSLLICCAVAVSTAHGQQVALDLDGLEETVTTVMQSDLAPIPEQSQPQAETVPVQPKQKTTFWMLIRYSGLVGFTIILLSLIAVALMIEHALSLRRTILMPPNFADDVLKLLTQGQSQAALQKCQNDPSALAQILYAGLSQYEFGWESIEKSAEEATASEASRLYRKVEYLNMIGNIAPMIGLLGTVVGMVIAFQQMAESAGYGHAADLAEGIYLALVTTIQGLLVAIPCLAAHSLFGNRIATLITETTLVAEHVLQPIRKNLSRKRSGVPS